MSGKTKINYILTGSALMFMMIMPFKFQFIKLGVVILCILYASKKNELRICAYSKQWVGLLLLCNVMPFIYAVISDNPGYNIYVNAYFLWPILYLYLMGTLYEDFYVLFHKIMTIGFWIVIGIGLLAFVFYNVNGLVTEDFLSVKPVLGRMPFITISDGCVNSIVFLYSYFLVYGLITKKNNFKLLFSGVIFIFFTSRRAIIVELVLAVVCYYCISSLCRYRVSKKPLFVLLGGVIIFALAAIFVINYYSFFEFKEILDAFSQISELSDSERHLQYQALIKGWLESPILGNGTGIDASYARSEKPGTYELSYIAILFERGIVGFTLYIGLLLSLNIKAIKCVRTYPQKGMFIIPLLTATDMMLVANATNNYIQAFDYIWVLFILFPFFRKNYNEKYMYSNPCL